MRILTDKFLAAGIVIAAILLTGCIKSEPIPTQGEKIAFEWSEGQMGDGSLGEATQDSIPTPVPPTPDPPTPPDPPVTTSGWAELPAMYESNTLYYASHSFTMNKKEYRNYTVCYSIEHKCALWVAAPRHKVYSTKGCNRTDAYTQDPDIPSTYQYKSKDTGGGCNKGHLLGSQERLCCTECNKQVFYYTNIAPQLSSGFNTGGGGWNTLEDWIDGKECADTLYEVIGCYFKDYTDGYKYTGSPATISFGGRNDVTRPSMFYYAVLRTKTGNTGKSVVNCTADELMCAAFVRAHNNGLKGQEVSAQEMMSISDLEKITGVTYFVNVPNAPKTTYKASDWGL